MEKLKCEGCGREAPILFKVTVTKKVCGKCLLKEEGKNKKQ